METDYNIYKELGLNPKTDNAERVKAEVEKQYRSWMNKINLGPRAKEKVAFYKKMRDAINANPTLIAEHAALYAEVVRKEKMQQEKAIRDQAAIFVVNGEIEEKNLKELASKNKAFTEAEILAILGAKTKQKRQFRYSDDPTVPEIDSTLYRQITADLERLGKKSLYDFLNLRANASRDDIMKAAQALYNENQKRQAGPVKVQYNNLVGHCRSLLGDDAKRRSYDKTLSNAGFIPVREKIQRLSIIIPEQYKALLEECTRAGIPRDKAEYLIWHAAEAKGISVVESTENDALRPCRFCGSLNNPSAKVCKSCGLPIVIVCPKCGHKSTDPDELKCTQCGFSIGDMPTADLHLKSAATAMNLGNIAEARLQLESAKRLWPAHPRLNQTEADLRQAEKQTAEALSEAKKLAEKRRYTAASAYLNRIGFSAESETLRKEIESAVESAAKLVETASRTTDSSKRADLYMQALSICADCREALDRLRLTPPSAPASVSATAAPAGIHVAWNRSNSTHITYDIVRKANGRPTSLSDGTLVGSTSGTMIDDTSAEKGTSYFYAVFSACGDIKSRTGCVTPAPVLLTEEIDRQSLTYDIQAKSIGLNWKLPRNAAGVEILRDGSPLRTVNGSSLIDSNLQSDREYTYTLRTIYNDCNGKRVASNGITLKLKPVAPPEASRLNATDNGNTVTLDWTSPRRGIVAVYHSTRPFTCNPNDIINLDTIKATKLNVSGTRCTVNKDFSGERFFMPVTIEGTVGVAGNTVSIVSVMSPENVRLERRDNQAFLSWDWGKASAARITVQNDNNSPSVRTVDKSSKPSLLINIADSASSLKVTVAGVAVTASGREVTGQSTTLTMSLRSQKVDFTEAKSNALFGLFGRGSYTLTLRCDGQLPCPLNVLTGEGLPPVDLTTANVCHVISPSDFNGGVAKVKVDYRQRDTSKKLFFRIVAANRDQARQIKIVPDTRQV